MTPNKITGANAVGPHRSAIWSRWAARIAQFCRSAFHPQAACAPTRPIPRPTLVSQFHAKGVKTTRVRNGQNP